MRRSLALGAIAVLAGAGVAVALGGGPDFMKLDTALALAAQTGKPVAVYAVVNSKGEGC